MYNSDDMRSCFGILVPSIIPTVTIIPLIIAMGGNVGVQSSAIVVPSTASAAILAVVICASAI